MGTPRFGNFAVCAWEARSGSCYLVPHLALSLAMPHQASRLASIFNSYFPKTIPLGSQREGVNQIFKAVWFSRKNTCCGTESALQVAPWIRLGARPLLSKPHQVPVGHLRKLGPFSGLLFSPW